MAISRSRTGSRRNVLVFDVIDRLASLEMRARDLAEGTMAGLQRSPYLGVSSEFAQHRQYVPGDDVRHMDWRVYGRTERYYIRQFQEETNFVVTFLIDCSESMQFGSTGQTKLDYACLLAASLSYLVLRQSDAVSLALFDDNLVTYMPPRTGIASLGPLAERLETIEAEKGTNLLDVVPLLTHLAGRRGVFVLISDLLDVDDSGEPEEIPSLARTISQVRLSRHEMIVFQTLDPQELGLEFTGRVKFEGLEGLPSAVAEPNRIQAQYLEILHAFLANVRGACAQAGVEYALANTSESVDRLLIRYLAARAKIGVGRR